jgi:hypothetical protein
MKQLTQWRIKSPSALRSPMTALLAGVWLAAGAALVTALLLTRTLVESNEALARVEQKAGVFQGLNLAPSALPETHYQQLVNVFTARYSDLEFKAEKDRITITAKAAGDYPVFEQALLTLAGSGGPVRYEALSLCTGAPGQCKGGAYSATVQGKAWSLQ